MSQQFKPEEHINDTALKNYANGTLPDEAVEVLINPHLNKCPYCLRRYQIQREQSEMEQKTKKTEIHQNGHISEETIRQLLNEKLSGTQARNATLHIHQCRECLQRYTEMGIQMGKKIL